MHKATVSLEFKILCIINKADNSSLQTEDKELPAVLKKLIVTAKNVHTYNI